MKSRPRRTVLSGIARWLGLGVLFMGPLFHAFATDVALLPVADTYLRANQPTTAFGAAATIESNNANGVRVMLLRFDLRAISQPTKHLRLDLTAVAGNAGNVFQVFGLTSGENWDEATVSWSTAPGVNHSFNGLTGVQADYLDTTAFANSGAALASYSSAATGLVNVFDVSSGPVLDFVNADADKVVTFLIAEADPSDIPGDRYNAREASTGQPVLTVTTGATPFSLLRVVLVGGQSNADGRAVGSGLPANLQTPQADVPFYYCTYGSAANSDGTSGLLTTLRPGATQMPSGGFGPEVLLGYNLAPIIESQPGAALAIIKYAQGGTNLYTQWRADGTASSTNDGPVYQTFQNVVRSGLAKLRATYPGVTISLAGMIWVQGESDIDAGSAAVSAYGANLTQFVADVRTTFCPTLPFFLSRISSHQTVYSSPTDPDYPNYLTIRDQQAQVVANVPNTYLIDTDGDAFTMNSDALHFNTGGQQAMGAAFAQVMASVLSLRTTAQAREGNILLKLNSLPGKNYQVLSSPDLRTWTSQDVGATGTWIEPITNPSRFYRISERDDTVLSTSGN